MKYRKKPVVIDAIQYQEVNGEDNLGEIIDFVADAGATPTGMVDATKVATQPGIRIFNTEEQQWINCPPGHWVIKGVNGEFYPCSDDVFRQTYEEAEG